MDLFEYQAILLGGWVLLNGSVRAIRPGITRPYMAECGGNTVVVGSQIGFQLSCPAGPANRQDVAAGTGRYGSIQPA